MLTTEIIPSHGDRLDRGVMGQRLRMSIGQPGESSALHPNREIDALDIACANLRGVGIPEANGFLAVYYLGRKIRVSVWLNW